MEFIMSFNVNFKEFKNLLQKVYPVVPTRTPYNALLNFKFVVENKELKVYATDIDTSIVAKISIGSEENQTFVVNAKKIYDWTTIYSGDENLEISIDVSHSNVALMRGKSKSNFACVDINDYPPFQSFEKDKLYELEADKIKYIAGKVCNFSAAKESGRNRGALEGVYFDCSRERLIAVATDANKLSIVSYGGSFGFDGDLREVIPTKPLNEVSKILEAFDYESVKFSFSNDNTNSVSFFTDDFELITKLVDGQYPDYEKVIPKEYNKAFSADRQELINALKVTAAVADKTNNLTKFYMDKNELRLHSEDINTNSKSDEFLDIEYDYDQSFLIGFNSVYLIEILSAIDTEKVKFEFTGILSVALIRPVYSEEDEKKNVLFLLTPLRISE
jgi:DNA polymerase-3 subunit beta